MDKNEIENSENNSNLINHIDNDNDKNNNNDSSTFKITYIQKENIKPISKSKLFQDFNFQNTNLNTTNNSFKKQKEKKEEKKICIIIENKTSYIKNKEFQLLIQV
jgi:hypothetical protein